MGTQIQFLQSSVDEEALCDYLERLSEELVGLPSFYNPGTKAVRPTELLRRNPQVAEIDLFLAGHEEFLRSANLPHSDGRVIIPRSTAYSIEWTRTQLVNGRRLHGRLYRGTDPVEYGPDITPIREIQERLWRHIRQQYLPMTTSYTVYVGQHFDEGPIVCADVTSTGG